MKYSVFAAVLAAALSVAASPLYAETIEGVNVGDQYLSPHSSNKGTVPTVPVFAFPPDPDAPFSFNFHYSTMPVKWTLDLPQELEGKTLDVVSATVVVWNAKGNGGWDPNSTETLTLFNAGITGDRGFTRDTWTESDFYYNSPVSDIQEPYLVELGTGDHAEDKVDATPWATGVVDPSYQGEEEPVEAFPITFNFDVSNPEIKNQLLTDLENGYSMFVVASSYGAAQSGGVYPRLVTKEGVADTSNGTLQKAPSLTIEVQETASARDWHLY